MKNNQDSQIGIFFIHKFVLIRRVSENVLTLLEKQYCFYFSYIYLKKCSYTLKIRGYAHIVKPHVPKL